MTISRTYELPDPVVTGVITGHSYSLWTTRRSIEIDRDAENDRAVVHYHERETIYLDTGRQDIALDYDEAQRIALALLASVEQANTRQENQ